MATYFLDEKEVRSFCQQVFRKRGFSEQESADIADVLLTADLYGIESHGIQRLIRYHLALDEGSICADAAAQVVFETAISAVIDAPRTMGQVVGKAGMQMAISKASSHGIGMVTVRGSNHYGIAGYYTSMAAKEDMLGVCMTNTEAIMVPTYGRQAMLGTNPIAVCMPADPVDFWYDAATTVVTRGKLEVFGKKDESLPMAWAVDENGQPCSEAPRVIGNIIQKLGGGIMPLGGASPETGSHKGYGLGIIVELFTSILAGGTTAPHVKNSGNSDTSFCFWAIDYGIFGDKKVIRQNMSSLLAELRASPRAEGQERIYTHGEKEFESKIDKLKTGIPVNEKTLTEMRRISSELDVHFGITL